MIRVLRALFDGLIGRCPRCHAGRMFERGFRMRRACPRCGLEFERSVGEITGGMGINTVATLLLITVASLVFGRDPSIPLAPLLLALAAFAIVFPIAFYRSSRGLWASFLFLTGDNAEPDQAGRMR
ncbi:MAG TPA: DUF983 domain-containing protein [Kouleothrix sp.]|uniref:DUF983 domain-containing protein n=1 Tax=Kouleothrix sp. TaxID=2779161 RepID=UPI002D13DF9E|nr:DUF983 domain-containing protein [Kouleothrix sp.]HRC77437.1 DUF983 domain-containing protein [Kouleothrix sp.]